jgi:pSer/pThr/pTyr-binding forkhead associated (FHA) protein
MQLPHALHRASAGEIKDRLEAERRGRPFLLYRDGDDVQRILDLADAPASLTIGRRESSGVSLAWDTEVSRVHARLERIEEEWTLVDDGGSRNGSFLNGARIHGRRRLRDGDTIGIGRSILVFRRPTGRESVRTATSDGLAVPRISDAQRRVLVALCRPYSDPSFGVPATNQQIADELFVGVETVKTHLKALFEAFGVAALAQHQKRAVLAQRALDTGAVTPQDLAPPATPTHLGGSPAARSR